MVLKKMIGGTCVWCIYTKPPLDITFNPSHRGDSRFILAPAALCPRKRWHSPSQKQFLQCAGTLYIAAVITPPLTAIICRPLRGLKSERDLRLPPEAVPSPWLVHELGLQPAQSLRVLMLHFYPDQWPVVAGSRSLCSCPCACNLFARDSSVAAWSP